MKSRIFIDAFVLRFPRTGIVSYTQNVIERLARSPACDVTLLLHDLGFHDPELGRFAQSLDHRQVGETGFERRIRELMGELWQVPGLPLPVPGVTTRATDPCDVYHCTDIYYYPSARAHANFITMYDLTTTLFPGTHEAINIEKERFKLKALDGFDKIIAISESTRQDLIEHVGIAPERVVTNYLGVDAIYENPRFQPRKALDRALGIPAGRRYLLSVATIEPRKNIIGALKAFQLFVDRHPQDDDVILVLAGHYGWNNEGLQKFLAGYRAIDRIMFTGFVPNELMPTLYHHAEAFIYLSVYEGFGLPILEAMKSSAPVVCSNVSSMPEIIGDCGLTVSPNDPEEAVAAVERILHKPATAADFRARALKRAAGFGWDRHVAALADLYGISLAEFSPPLRASQSTVVAEVGESAKVQSPEQAAYAVVVRREQREMDRDARSIRQHVADMAIRPAFVVLIEPGARKRVDETAESCTAQFYPASEVITEWKPGRRNPRQQAYLIRVAAGDRLHPLALYECAAMINRDPALEMIVFDEDRIDASGVRSDPFHKPEWSPDYLEAFNYVGHGACYAFPLAATLLGEASGAYDFTLRYAERASRIATLHKVLLHRRAGPAGPPAPAQIAGDLRALNGRLARTGRKGTVKAQRPGRAVYRVEPVLARRPLVSIVIPTAARTVSIEGRPRDLIRECVRSIVERSTYRNIEIVIVDNGDLDRDRIGTPDAIPVRYLTYREQQVNISRKLNLGAASAAGEFLLLLNDDTEVIAPDWIEQMLFHFEKPHVGLVGGKLLYPDSTLQHAGVVVVHGHPDHVSRGMERDHDGHFFSASAVHNYQAVTGALMLVRAGLYQELAGYDETMPLTFNDIDLCMRIRRKGLTIVYEPAAELFHFEGKSAINSYNLDDRDTFFERWSHDFSDPFYNVRYRRLAQPDFTFLDNGRYL